MYRTVVTICTAQWSLYVRPTGRYMYRAVVTICTASLTFTILRSAHIAVFMCFVWISEKTAIISLYNTNWLVCITETECVYCMVRTGCLYINNPLNSSGHYMYRPVVTIYTAQWSLYVPHSGHYMYHQVWHSQSYVLPTQLYLCVLCGSQNKQPLFPYTALTDWFV